MKPSIQIPQDAVCVLSRSHGQPAGGLTALAVIMYAGLVNSELCSSVFLSYFYTSKAIRQNERSEVHIRQVHIRRAQYCVKSKNALHPPGPSKKTGMQ
ncbi:hypothetical protein GQ53DRAFT_93842 [Thozetella sp. PMI_491]|nr:hypothetical protein GQ53DRAFT_93842 [Thozetella sp. PMI_491]